MITREALYQQFRAIRNTTEDLCKPLLIEDYVIQSCEDVSPPKWHLAHTSWFFETFILSRWPDYHKFDPLFDYLFNSYYQTIGSPYPRPKRGLLARPSTAVTYDYRQAVNEALGHFIDQASDAEFTQLIPLMKLGLHHEQQHQELLLMDIKHNLSMHMDFPVYQSASQAWPIESYNPKTLPCIQVAGGTTEIGYGGDDFCFDNELPRHQAFLQPYTLANALVTNGDYLEFIDQKGYSQPQWWLADGWDTVNRFGWEAPLYWVKRNKQWQIFTLSGLRDIDPAEPVSHVSYYEADAYARWRGCRLPTEEEWEHFVLLSDFASQEGNFLESGHLHPRACTNKQPCFPQQFLGDLWEWTSSAYLPYPGYKPLAGSLGEYNGKFMNNQMVLRGGCCVTPRSHMRATYRNFFQPEKRWQFSGIRLANTN